MPKQTIDPGSETSRASRRDFVRNGLYGLGVAGGISGMVREASAAEGASRPQKSYSGMKITDVKVEIYESQVREPAYKRWKIWIGEIPKHLSAAPHRFGILRVYTDAGIEGVCHVRDVRSAQELIESVRPLVMDRDPLDREFIWQTLWKMERIYHFSIWTHSAIDVALWDIAAKAANLPLYKLLGGYQDKIPMYRSSTLLMEPEEFAKEAVLAKAQGYHAYKLHPAGDFKKDIESCRAVRAAVGPDYDVMLDPIGAYDHEGAMTIGREIERLGFLWFEEPLPEWDIRGYTELVRTLDIPICGPEVIPGSVYLTADYITQKATDIARADVALKGGITGVMKTAHLAEAFGMNIELHVTYSQIMNAAQAHIACAIKNTLFLERLGTDAMNAGWEGAYGVSDNWVNIDNEGYVTVPQTPGIGIDIDRDLLGDPVEIL